MVRKEKILFSEEGILFSDWSGRRGYCSVIGHLMPDTGWHSSSALGASRSLARADTCPAPDSAPAPASCVKLPVSFCGRGCVTAAGEEQCSEKTTDVLREVPGQIHDILNIGPILTKSG